MLQERKHILHRFNSIGIGAYYILEHKVSSKYHRAGEAQEIIVDQIELGRDSRCQVRFDDSFSTVSRRHAAIVKDGDNWKLVQISKTNTTLLNGRPVKTEWYLQNGDEIQLSINGPKLGFIIPTGKKATVGSIGLTRRLSLFRQQALRPYKRALAALAVLLVLASGVGGAVIFKQHGEIKNLIANNETAKKMIEKIISDADKNDSIYKAQLDSLSKIKPKTVIIKKGGGGGGGSVVPKDIASLVATAKPYVYYVKTTTYLKMPDKTLRVSHLGGTGTGFLLSDGRFYTARHCVQPWLYSTSQANALATRYEDVEIYAVIEAQSMTGDYIKFSSKEFTVPNNVIVTPVAFQDKETGETKEYKVSIAFPLQYEDGRTVGSEQMWGDDWAYVKTSKSEGLASNPSKSSNLKAGTPVYVLGFPAGLGFKDGKAEVEPIFNQMTVSRDGLNSSRCVMVSQGVAHGNSGGPVFIVNNGKLDVIAIVSRLESATQQYGTFGIIQQQQQYDQLVPMSNVQ